VDAVVAKPPPDTDVVPFSVDQDEIARRAVECAARVGAKTET